LKYKSPPNTITKAERMNIVHKKIKLTLNKIAPLFCEIFSPS
jgi:hypothetical protein